ncbi:PHD finger family protein / bromo-adjacent homology domain-containing protein [Perilla frutescens var. hirtella]|nr:PHD finger family protein / bromo-adjacent homology domain-containing protein [Perilla frutescens var. hirtella]
MAGMVMEVGRIGGATVASSSSPNTLLFPKAGKSRVSVVMKFPPCGRRRRWWSWAAMRLEQPGGKIVVELVGAFNELTERMNVLSSSSSLLLFKTLKLSLPLLHSLSLLLDGRDLLSKALSLALFLAHLQMDAEAICAGILRQVIDLVFANSVFSILRQLSLYTLLLALAYVTIVLAPDMSGDCVLMRPSDSDKPPYMARVEKLEADHMNNIKVRVRCAHTIEGKCIVHTFKNYTKLENVGTEDYFCRFEYKAAIGSFTADRVAV